MHQLNQPTLQNTTHQSDEGRFLLKADFDTQNQAQEADNMNTNAMHETQPETDDDFIGSATYSPEDNKLRLYPFARLDKATYDRVHGAGFKWAPKQGLFVAPMWTPARFDLLLTLCGDVGDEDKSLAERAAERADRMSDYSSKRTDEANRARAAVSAIADNIPFGQPILVGHHSERRARKDAERIENGMRRAVNLWETANYWKHRAAGALAHAEYKELPAVRHRRIKGLEADKRKQERAKQEAEMWLKLWIECEAEQDAELQKQVAERIAGMCWLHMPRKEGDRPDFDQCPTAHSVLTNAYPNLYAPRTIAEVVAVAKTTYPRTIAYCDRWIAHYENRIAYERAMLDEQGGLKAESVEMQPGGRVLIGDEWLVIIRVNKKAGAVCSVTTNARYVSVRGIEEIKDYRAPTEEEAAKVKKVTKLAPLVNFPMEGCIEMTAEEYKRKAGDYKGTRTQPATATHGAYRYRTAFLANSGYRTAPVFLTDSKRVDPPAAPAAPVEPLTFERQKEPATITPATEPAAAIRAEDNPGADFDAMRQQLKTGVQIVAAPQLFPTPAPTADRMAEEADIQAGETVADFSAGTGRLLLAARKANPECIRTGVEINAALCDELRRVDPDASIHHADFMAWDNGEKFAVILLNPPFANGQDIAHIKRARDFLAPGGRLVAICANGPRQAAQLLPMVEACGGIWEPLPANTFAESGTGVNTVLLTLNA